MTSRRKFLQQSGALALTSLSLSHLVDARQFSGVKVKSIGLQLYTLGELMSTDPKGTLQKLAAIGYKELESAGSAKGNYYGYTPKEFAVLVKDAGLHWRSAHVGGVPFTMDMIMKMAKPKTAQDSLQIKAIAERMNNIPKALNLLENYQQLADDSAEGGIGYLVCAAIPVSTVEELKTAVEVFNKAGEACHKVGVQFAYHNHATEFDQVDGQRPFDYILANTDKHLVKMGLDLGWATIAGQDPVTLFKAHPGRFPIWHVKDMNKTTKAPTEVGKGMVDFKRIFDHANESGMKYFFVEQDQAPKPLENVTNSYNHLKKVLA